MVGVEDLGVGVEDSREESQAQTLNLLLLRPLRSRMKTPSHRRDHEDVLRQQPGLFQAGLDHAGGWMRCGFSFGAWGLRM